MLQRAAFWSYFCRRRACGRRRGRQRRRAAAAARRLWHACAAAPKRARVASLRGYMVTHDRGCPFKFNEESITAAASDDGGLAARLFSMSAAQARELLEEEDVPLLDDEGGATLFATPQSFFWHADAQVQLAQEGRVAHTEARRLRALRTCQLEETALSRALEQLRGASTSGLLRLQRLQRRGTCRPQEQRGAAALLL